MMTSSSNISAHDHLIDHPFPCIELVTPTDHDHGDGGHYCHNWSSQLDQHKDQQVGSDDGRINQVMDARNNGIDQAWAWEHNELIYDPSIGSADMDSDDKYDNWVPTSKLKVVKKINPKRASSTANPTPALEISSTNDFPYLLPADQNDSSSNGNNNNNNGIRVCSDCNTTKTPLWRSGPKGPKSLCNACGIRQRKARRALAAAAATGSSDNNALTKASTICPKSLKIKMSSNTKEKKSCTTKVNDDNSQGWQQPYKKRMKQADHNYHQSTYTSVSHDSNPSSGKDADDYQYCGLDEQTNSKRICFEEFITVSLSKNAALHRVFPQDEKEAAILLMALSCGLVHN